MTCSQTLKSALLLIVITIAAGHPADTLQASSPDGPQKTILHAVGADSMASLMQCWTAQFEALHPKVSVTYRAALSADGAIAMLENTADFAPFAREFFPAEISAFQSAFDAHAALIRVASGSFDRRGKSHALAIYVHRDNPLVSLSLEQLQHIFTSASGELTWGDVGLAGDWASRPVKRFGMLNLRSSGNPPGIVNFMRHRLNDAAPLSDDIVQLPGNAEVHALQQIVDSVAADPHSIGYTGFLFTNRYARTLPISVSASHEAVTGSFESVKTHSYPLARYIYMAIHPALEPAKKAAVSDFMDFIQTQAGQDCVDNDDSGFISLPAEVVAVNKVEIATFRGNQPAATNYRTVDGRIRVVGYNDMEPMLKSLGSLFSERHPGAAFELVLKGTRTAPPALIDGSSAFAPMGAEFSVLALQEYRRRYHSDPVKIRIAHSSLRPQALSGPLALFVHSSNPLNEISVRHAAAVYTRQQGIENIQFWGQLGLGGSWADRPIQACGLRPGRALATFLTEHLFSGAPYSTNVVGFAQSLEAVQFAAGNVNSLCFAAFNRGSSDVKALAISLGEGKPAYSPTEETVLSGQYPLDRHLYIYIRNLPGSGIDQLVRGYLQMVLSPAGQKLIKSASPGYLPLNENEVAVELKKLDHPGKPLPSRTPQ